MSGKSGIGPITHFLMQPSIRPVLPGEVKDFDVTQYGIDRKEARHMDPSTQYAVAATKLALDDSGMKF